MTTLARQSPPAAAPAVHRLAAGRAASIDAFRGLTFLAMIFVNELGGVTGITPWLKHMPADADAMSFPDVVFPAFLFIVGMSIPFSVNARLARGGDAWDVQRHIVSRAFALIVMGVFMVNAEEGFDAKAMPLPIELWSLLFYAAVFMVWGVWRTENAALMRWLRIAGVGLMVVLALLYRGAPGGSGWMAPHWWGILGLIGWAYFFSCEFHLLARGRVSVLLALLVACVAYYAAASKLALPPAIKWLFSQAPHAAHSQIVLAGTICTLIFFDMARRDSLRRRFVEALAFALALAAAATMLRPFFPISKIYATPSWCLYTAALCVALFGLLYALIDISGHDRWTRLVAPAAASPLVTYLLPFVVVAVLSLLGLTLPPALRHGAGGLLWAAFYAALIVWVVSWLTRWGIGLRL
ncbi:MAG TPA: DUF5009 domain-containing protein [Albitalea sp.]|uniref:DUF5009 domain-containing protein n=1 Tax=Piscinibacter sp. TaxID=1903157 RepID=UPI002ED119E3